MSFETLSLLTDLYVIGFTIFVVLWALKTLWGKNIRRRNENKGRYKNDQQRTHEENQRVKKIPKTTHRSCR